MCRYQRRLPLALAWDWMAQSDLIASHTGRIDAFSFFPSAHTWFDSHQAYGTAAAHIRIYLISSLSDALARIRAVKPQLRVARSLLRHACGLVHGKPTPTV